MAAFSVQRRLGLCSPGLTGGDSSVSSLKTFERQITSPPVMGPIALLHKADPVLRSDFLGAATLCGRAQTLQPFRCLTKPRIRIEASARPSSTMFRSNRQLSTCPGNMASDGASRSQIKRRCRCRAASRGTQRNGSERNGRPETATNGAAEAAPDGANRTKGAGVNKRTEANVNAPGSKFRSSWDAKDSTGRTYIENLGKASENVNMVVGAKEGMIDSVFIGDFLGKESDIVFKYRQKVTRQFGHIHGDYYIAPAFMDKVVTHIAKNFLADQIKARTPLILGVWGGKGQGKSFQVELIFRALGLEPVIMSAGELESEWAGTPARLIRDRYRTAGQVVKVQGKMSALVINDIDAGAGRFENTQMTVNTQMVMGTLMNLADNPTRVSVGQEFREADVVPRVPIILTGNDLSTLWAPLIRDGRMDKFYWTPTRDDLINIVTCMYRKDGLAESDIEALVDVFPKQALDFYGAMRSRTYDNQVKKWLDSVGGPEKLRNIFPVRPGKEHPQLDHYQQTLENLIKAGRELVEEQEMVTSLRLSDEYMNSPPAGAPGIGLTLS